MANTIKIKRKTTAGAPSIGDLVDGEMCLVVPDNVVYLRVSSSLLISYMPTVAISQASYDALGSKNANTIYLITG